MTSGTRKTYPDRIAQGGEGSNHAIPNHPTALSVAQKLQNKNEQATEVQRLSPSELSQALTALSTNS